MGQSKFVDDTKLGDPFCDSVANSCTFGVEAVLSSQSHLFAS